MLHLYLHIGALKLMILMFHGREEKMLIAQKKVKKM